MAVSAALLLHPVRLRIVQCFLGERELTTAQLHQQLSDVSTPTLYRQVATLVGAEVLEVTAERRIRGAVERTYRLRLDKASVSPDHLATMSVEEHRAAFMTFVAGLLADFDRYLAQGDVDLIRDGVGYRQAGFYATDVEFDQLTAAIKATVAPYLDAAATPDRTHRLLATILTPASGNSTARS